MAKEKRNLMSLEAVCEFLRANDDYLILTHKSPDGDTLGSGFALLLILQSMGKKARVICPDPIPEKYGFFVSECENPESGADKTVVAVDVADKKLLGALCEVYGDEVDLTIDHHLSNTGYAKRTYLDDGAAANCEIIFSIAKMLSAEINELLALCLYTGISTDTGCFRFSNTTEKTFLAAAELMKIGIDAFLVNRLMFETKSKERLALEAEALGNIEYFFGDKCAVIAITKEMYERTGCKDEELEGITTLPRTIEGVLAGITIREKENGGYRVSVRTYAPLDASEICARLGGGGHIRAAGCEFKGDLGIEKVKETVLEQVKAVMEEDCAGITFN